MPLESLNTPLVEGAKALGLALSERQREVLLEFVDLLQKWNRVYNLTALRDPADMLTHHILDSLAALPPADRELSSRRTPGSMGRTGSVAPRILDVGSGGGLPGAVWAVLHPDWQITCIDAVGKKSSFVQQAATELGLRNLSAVHARVEDWSAPPFDVVTSRAFASLADFTRLTRHLLNPEGCWLAMKGKEPREEIAALSSDCDVFHVEHLAVPGLDADRCLVWIRPTAQKGTP